MPKVIVSGPDLVAHEYPIEHEMTLGRHAINEIAIQEEKASRRHCRFRPDNGRIMLEDLDSSNGTKVNGRKITTYVLKHGDTITIGAHTIIFHDETERLDRTMVLQEAITEPVAKEPKAGLVMTAVEAPPPKPKVAVAASAAPKKRERPERDSEPEEESEESGPEAKSSSTAVFTFALMVVVAGAAFYLGTRSNQSSKPNPPVRTDPEHVVAVKDPEKDPAPPVTIIPQPKLEPIPPPVVPKVVLPKVPRVQPADPAVLAELNKALAERDRAIGSGNFQAARTAVSTFLNAHPDGEAGQRAQQELKDTETLIEAALEVSWNDAQRGAGDKKYRVVTQRCTRLVSADPMGKFGKQARELLTQIDTTSEPRFTELNTKAAEQMKAGLLDKAAETLERGVDELGGTKWSEPISATQLRLLMARSVLRQIESARAKRAATGKPVTINLSAKKITGTLVKVNGLSLDLKAGAIAMTVPLKELPPADLQSLLQGLGLTAGNLELAYLWLLLDKPANAQADLEAALNNPAQAADAIKLANLLPNQKNLRIYDFSKWQHQMDWEAISGSWSTQNDRYVLESAEGGETSLKSAAIGGPIPAKGLRVSFDFELAKTGEDWFFAFEFGDENQHAVSATFNAKEVILHANLDGALNEKESWKPAPAHIDVAVTGNSFTISINGQKCKSLEVPGLEELKGTLAFRIRETAAAIDNIVIRNIE